MLSIRKTLCVHNYDKKNEYMHRNVWVCAVCLHTAHQHTNEHAVNNRITAAAAEQTRTERRMWENREKIKKTINSMKKWLRMQRKWTLFLCFFFVCYFLFVDSFFFVDSLRAATMRTPLKCKQQFAVVCKANWMCFESLALHRCLGETDRARGNQRDSFSQAKVETKWNETRRFNCALESPFRASLGLGTKTMEKHKNMTK